VGRDAGVIAPGRLADLLALDTGHVDLEGRAGDTLLDAYVFAADDRAVSDVWAAGRHLVSGGRHVQHEAITGAYRTVLRRLTAL
jgi:formimidoylglutamate deiminase